MQYRRNRYYDPQTGRFTQQDPAGLGGGTNLYGFASGDPVNFADPFGLADCPAGYVAGGDACYNEVAVLGMAIGAAFSTAEIGLQALENAGRALVSAAEDRFVLGNAKIGSADGPGSGKQFSAGVQDPARAESGDKCVLCGETTIRSKAPAPNRSNIDHAIPKSRGGNNTIDNAQNTCQTCNLRKGALTTEEYLKKISGGKPIALLQYEHDKILSSTAFGEDYRPPSPRYVARARVRDVVGREFGRGPLSAAQRSLLRDWNELWGHRQFDTDRRQTSSAACLAA